MKKIQNIVEELEVLLNKEEGPFKGINKKQIIANAVFFDDAPELFSFAHVENPEMDSVETFKGLVLDMSKISADDLKDFKGTVAEYMLSIHPNVFIMADGQYVFMENL